MMCLLCMYFVQRMESTYKCIGSNRNRIVLLSNSELFLLIVGKHTLTEDQIIILCTYLCTLLRREKTISRPVLEWKISESKRNRMNFDEIVSSVNKHFNFNTILNHFNGKFYDKSEKKTKRIIEEIEFSWFEGFEFVDCHTWHRESQ